MKLELIPFLLLFCLQSHDVDANGPPEIGEHVTVNWEREELVGKYSGSHTYVMYTLQFEDGSKISVRREHFYLMDETLPKRIEERRVCTMSACTCFIIL